MARADREEAERRAVALVAAWLEAQEVHALEYRAHLVMARLLERVAAALDLREPWYRDYGEDGDEHAWSLVLAGRCRHVGHERMTAGPCISMGHVDNTPEQLLGMHAAALKAKAPKHPRGYLDDEGRWLDGEYLEAFRDELLDLDHGVIWRIQPLSGNHPVALAWGALRHGHTLPSPRARRATRAGSLGMRRRALVSSSTSRGPYDAPLAELPGEEPSTRPLDAKRLRVWREVRRRGEQLLGEERIPAQVVPLSKLRSPGGDISPHLIRYLVEEHLNYAPPGVVTLRGDRRMTYQQVADILGYHVESIGNAMRKLKRQ